MSTSTNWGGKRQGAGRRPKYVRIEKTFYTERSAREPIPESDLTICLAETQYDPGMFDRGIVIDDIWYDANEALAIAEFIQKHHVWLSHASPS